MIGSYQVPSDPPKKAGPWEIKEGYLWVTATPQAGATAADEVPLLSSARKLLELLELPVPGASKDADAAAAVDADTSSERKTVTTPYGELKKYSDNPQHNLTNTMLNVLMDIRNFKDRDDAPPQRSGRVSRMEAETKRLKEQQDHLMSIDKQGKEVPEKEDTPAQEDKGVKSDPMYRSAQVCNSIFVLTPIYVDMFMHKGRDDVDIEIDGEKLPQQGRRDSKCWLFGEKVYTMAGRKLVKRVYSVLLQVWKVFGVTCKPQDKLDLDACDTVKEKMMYLLLDSYNEPKWCSNDLYSYFDSSVKEFLVANGKDVDKLCGLVEADGDDTADKYNNAIEKLRSRIAEILKKEYSEESTASIYGSCVTGVSLGKNADVDISLDLSVSSQLKTDFRSGKISPNKYRNDMSALTKKVTNILRKLSSEFKSLVPVIQARIMVIKGQYTQAENPYSEDGSIDFDLCFQNSIAVTNSHMLQEYTKFDARIKPLMRTIKQWARDLGMSSAVSNYLSSYSWFNMAIYYLQCIGMIPSLQSETLAKTAGVTKDADDKAQHVNDLDTFYLTWDQVKDVWKQPDSFADVSVSSLFYGFIKFYHSEFPSAFFMASIKHGAEASRFKSLFKYTNLTYLSIEDPFETSDSYNPHNLTHSTNDKTQEHIYKVIKATMNHLEKTLKSAKDDVSVIDKLWPKPEHVPQPTNEGRKKQRRGAGNADKAADGKAKEKRRRNVTRKLQHANTAEALEMAKDDAVAGTIVSADVEKDNNNAQKPKNAGRGRNGRRRQKSKSNGKQTEGTETAGDTDGEATAGNATEKVDKGQTKKPNRRQSRATRNGKKSAEGEESKAENDMGTNVEVDAEIVEATEEDNANDTKPSEEIAGTAPTEVTGNKKDGKTEQGEKNKRRRSKKKVNKTDKDKAVDTDKIDEDDVATDVEKVEESADKPKKPRNRNNRRKSKSNNASEAKSGDKEEGLEKTVAGDEDSPVPESRDENGEIKGDETKTSETKGRGSMGGRGRGNRGRGRGGRGGRGRSRSGRGGGLDENTEKESTVTEEPKLVTGLVTSE